jgi:error-prone DNA polymerase
MVSGIPAYAPLWCKSNYSFLEGASHPEELIEESLRLGVRSLGLTDRDGVYGSVRAYMKAREHGLHLILGSQMTLDDGSILPLLAMDREGYANLCQLVSRGRLRMPKGESQITWREVCEHAEGLIALWGGDRSLMHSDPDPLFVARDLVDAFGDRLYALVVRHRRAQEPVIERRVRERAERYGLPVVAGHEVLYHTPSRRPLQDVLTCIRHGVALSKAGTLTKPNAEHVLKSPHAFALLFQDDLYAVARTLEVASRCTFSLEEIQNF